MHPTDALMAALGEGGLTADDRGGDLQVALTALHEAAAGGVPSFLGLTLTVHRPGTAVAFTVPRTDLPGAGRVRVRASVLLSLDGPAGPDCDDWVVFYAAQPGVFLELAAAARLTPSRHRRVEIDQHLHMPDHHQSAPTGLAGTADLAELSDINQAIGVLIDRRHLCPGDAWTALAGLAQAAGSSVHHAARHLLDNLHDSPSADMRPGPADTKPDT